MLTGRYECASIEGVRSIANSVLRHRIALNFNGQAEGYDTNKIVRMLLNETPANAKAA